MGGGSTPSLASAVDLTQTSTHASLARDRGPREKPPAVRSAISNRKVAHPRTHECYAPEGTESYAPTTQQAERNASRAPARRRTSKRAWANVCGRRAGTLIPKTEPPHFLSHNHETRVDGTSRTLLEGLESVRKEGHGAVQITQPPALLPGGGRAMGKERRRASTTTLAQAHCNDCTVPLLEHNGLQRRAWAATTQGGPSSCQSAALYEKGERVSCQSATLCTKGKKLAPPFHTLCTKGKRCSCRRQAPHTTPR